MLFLNQTTPYLRILLPDGEYAQFIGGALEIDAGEPGYESVLAEAQRNPSISIMVNQTTCQYCGESYEGKAAAAQLGKHKKDIHFEVWKAEKIIEQELVIHKEVKARAGFACDVCAPVQTFGDAAGLADHVRLLHTAPPELDANGNTIGEPDRRAGEAEPPPAPEASADEPVEADAEPAEAEPTDS